MVTAFTNVLVGAPVGKSQDLVDRELLDAIITETTRRRRRRRTLTEAEGDASETIGDTTYVVSSIEINCNQIYVPPTPVPPEVGACLNANIRVTIVDATQEEVDAKIVEINTAIDNGTIPDMLGFLVITEPSPTTPRPTPAPTPISTLSSSPE